MPQHMPRAEITNSLVITFDVFNEEACNALQAELSRCGELWHFTKLRSFQRCLVVFVATVDARAAMGQLNNVEIQPGNRMHMYYSMHTPLTPRAGDYLGVPTEEKLWLISPPGSPPINWRQTREDPPNMNHLDRSLEAALQEISSGRFVLNLDDADDYSSTEECGLGLQLPPPSLSRPTISVGGIDLDSSDDDDDDCADSVCNPAAPKIMIQKCDDSPVHPTHQMSQAGWPSYMEHALSPSSRPSLAQDCVKHMYQRTARPIM